MVRRRMRSIPSLFLPLMLHLQMTRPPMWRAAAAAPAPAGGQAPKTRFQTSSASAPGQPSSQPGNLAELSAQCRETVAEIAEIAAQAGRLGVAIDAATALREGTTPGALRKLMLKRAADISNGAQTASAVLLYAVEATLADAIGLVIIRGPTIVSRSKSGRGRITVPIFLLARKSGCQTAGYGAGCTGRAGGIAGCDRGELVGGEGLRHFRYSVV